MSVTELIQWILSEFPEGVMWAGIGLFVLLLIVVLKIDMRGIIDKKKPKTEEMAEK